jgi:hypothetical protein
MKSWRVEITAEIPYPWMRSFAYEATNPGTAVSRALRDYRKAVKAKLGKSKKMTSFKIVVTAETPIE